MRIIQAEWLDKAAMLRSASCFNSIALASFLCSAAAHAAEVTLVGVFPGKAVLVIDGGAPRTLASGGRTPEGVRLLSVGPDVAEVEIEGVRRVLRLGAAPVAVGTGGESASSIGQQVSLVADARGHFLAQGSVNGAGLRFLVDTGATSIALSQADAVRAGVDYRNGQKVSTSTANGVAVGWQVRLDKVSIGEITLHGVDAIVLPGDMPFALLGMSFLNRTEMRRDGSTMVLRRRY